MHVAAACVTLFLKTGSLMNDSGPVCNIEHCSGFHTVTWVSPSKHAQLSPCISAKALRQQNIQHHLLSTLNTCL